MQTAPSAFTAEAKDSVRKPAHSVQVAWKKDYRAGISFFTIGVSTIGGADIIPGPAGVQSAWNRYLYDDESAYAKSVSFERTLKLPVGGVGKALADVELENTTGRYLPDYMGGTSSIYTAILPRRPIILNTGFNISGVDQTLPGFVGVLRRQPKVDVGARKAELAAEDFMGFLENKRVDQTSMYTDTRSDVLMETFLQAQGFGTAQYELDEGRQTIKFLLLESGMTYSDIMSKLIEAEGGQFYQDEEGKLIFENRIHWDTSPHNQIVQTIYTSDVLEAINPNEDHIINTVQVKAKPRAKQPNQLVFKLGASIEIGAGLTHEMFVDFDDPMLSIDTPIFLANTESDGSGSDVTASVTLSIGGEFAKSAKYRFGNGTAATAYITEMTIYGRPAKVTEEIDTTRDIDSSVTAFEERRYVLENDLVQSQSQAETLADTILLDHAAPNKLQEIVIRARPHLQLSDLISWQGKEWRIWGIATQLDPSNGFIQRLKLLQRQTLEYFTIGVSTIGGGDVIAP